MFAGQPRGLLLVGQKGRCVDRVDAADSRDRLRKYNRWANPDRARVKVRSVFDPLKFGVWQWFTHCPSIQIIHLAVPNTTVLMSRTNPYLLLACALLLVCRNSNWGHNIYIVERHNEKHNNFKIKNILTRTLEIQKLLNNVWIIRALHNAKNCAIYLQ